VSEPVSWYLVEPGWRVVDRDGEPVGEVLEVTGDPEADIFDGLHVRPPHGGDLYVGADRVGRIVEGRIEATESREVLAAGPCHPPGGAEIRRDRSRDL
jgi:hypothetical protein